jgi:hypothetical protein
LNLWKDPLHTIWHIPVKNALIFFPQVLTVGSQTTNLIFNLYLVYTLIFKSPNEKCDSIFNIKLQYLSNGLKEV